MSIRPLSPQVELADQKRRLLERLLQQKVKQQALVPLSTAQERLWFFEQLQEESTVYTIFASARLLGELQVELLEQSLRTVVQRHEALRTVFALENGTLVQRVQAEPAVQFVLKDLLCWPAEQREGEARRLALEDAHQPFDLQRGPLLRVLVVRVAVAEHLLLLNLHHIVADGWSCEIILRELSALYSAAVSGQTCSLSAQTVQYSDYVRWQQKQGQEWSKHLAYWQEQLKDCTPLQLPMSQARPAVATYRGERQWLLLPASTLARLKALGKQEGATLYMTLLSAFTTLLARYSGNEDVVVGTPAAGRSRQEFENVVGFFVNMLALRTNLAGLPSFLEILHRTRQVVLDAYTHQDVPFEKVVEAVTNERHMTSHPLFQVQFALQPVTLQDLQMADLRVKPYQLHNGTTKFDLSLFAWEERDGLMTSIEYNADLFTYEVIERFLQHFHTLLTHIVADPSQPWATLSFLTEHEQQTLLHTWNATASQIPGLLDVPTWFEQQVACSPEAPAVIYGSQTVSYQELDRRANQLAHVLQQQGVKADTLVGLYLERSPELVMAVLAVLKAGGAYVPLDPGYPAERLAFIAEHARLHCVVTNERLRGQLPKRIPYICLQREQAHIASQCTEKTERTVTGENLAYVIYTSGSTGVPKGVMVEHRGLSNYLAWAIQYYAVSAGNGSVVHSPLAFDLTISALFPALLSGKPVVLVPEKDALEHLVQEVRRGQQFSLLKLTPAHIDVLNQWLEPAELAASAHALVIGGEALRAESLQTWRLSAPRTRLINEYGPTETVVGCCIYEVAPDDASTGEVAIGRPIANTLLYVLDKHLCPVPVGVPGELYIGGAGVARGYINQAELTAERFVPDRFSRLPGARCYRTGDLVRYRADGVLEFLGRVDYQVKLRGYRIELGEIEVALLSHTAVKECVVVLQGTTSEEQTLVAYVVGSVTQAQATIQLRAYLQERLPAYMLPAAIVVLERLPLTSHGKIDRRALPVPSVEALEVNPGVSTAITPVEEVVLGIWRNLLKQSHVHIHDNFFALGGHSLLASRVIAQIRAIFQIELPLRSLFEAPSVAQLASRVEAALRQGFSGQDEPFPAAGTACDVAPLALAQRRLWFMEQLETSQPLYTLPFAVRLTGALDAQALQESLWDLVQRHASLRTTFEEGAQGPVQRLHAELPPTFQQIDLCTWEKAQQEEELQRLLRAEQHWHFDLHQGPLLRVCLVHLANGEHVLLVTLHHLIADAWSVQVILKEWACYYEARMRGEKGELAPLVLQYADYALWQQQRLAGERMKQQEAYWQKQLQDMPAQLELPTKPVRGGQASHRGASERFALSEQLVRGLKQLSQEEGTSLYMTLLAGYQLLLSRYTQQEDIVTGTPIGQREREELAGMVGFLVNTLVLRTNLSGNPSVREVLRRVRTVALEAYTHQDVPFERVVELVGSERDLNHTPLFQAAFVYEQMTIQESTFADLHLAPVEYHSDTAKFQLALGITETEQGYQGTLHYQSDLFEAGMIKQLGHHYLCLLEAMVACPEQTCSTLPMLTAQEQKTLLGQRSLSALEVGQADACLHDVFAQQVRRQPFATAVVFEHTSLTYAQLDQQANALAAHLQQLGVGPEAPVAICLDRSLELVVSILGVLKAGALYVPLDPAYPQERLAFMLQDSQASVLISKRSVAIALPEYTGQVCWLDDLDFSSVAEMVGLQITATPKNAAYMIYTSGSTGRPKGVVITHQNVLRLFSATQDTYHFNEHDVWTLFHSFAFDFSVWELWGALLFGGRLVIVPYLVSRSPEAFYKLLGEQHVTVLNQTPSAFYQLLHVEEDLGQTQLQTLRAVIFGGEALDLTRVRSWFARHGATQPELINMYGITETTVHVSYCPLSPALVEQGGGASLIGVPIRDWQIYLLDKNLQLVPPGVPGEMYVGGAGLARGYCQRPDLTAERFIPHPFSSEPGARLYQTGDQARLCINGGLEYLGRLDTQVKIRGFRIELGEIETQLLQHPAVRQAIVIAREDTPGDQRLTGYVVLRPQSACTIEELRLHLTQALPTYMVPAALMILNALPLTTNGKVDRRALPAPEQLEIEATSSKDLPTTLVEDILRGIWQQLLQRGELGVHDNFFLSGGHSLLASRVVAQIRSAFHISLSVRSLFEAPTIAQLAQQVEEALRHANAQPEEPVLQAQERPQEIPLALAQQRLWFLEQLETTQPLYNVPLAVRLRGSLDLSALQDSLEYLIQRHESLRTTFIESASGPVQCIHDCLMPQIIWQDMRHLPEDTQMAEMTRLMHTEQQTRFDLRQGPLLRVHVIRIHEEEHILFLTLHHIIADAWSVQVLLQEWGQSYAACCRGETAQLVPLPVQYADYAIWQREWLKGKRLKEQEIYWRERLQGIPDALELPTDRPRGHVASYRGASERFALSGECVRGLRKLSQEESGSLYMTLLAGYQILLSKYTQQEDIVVGTPSGQRTRNELMDMIGFLVNTLAIRTSLEGNPSVREVLRRVRQGVLEAYTHQDIPFERVVEFVGGERDFSHTPVFQTAFLYEQLAVQESHFADLALLPLDIPSCIAKFEVSLVLRETEQGIHGAILYNQDLFDAATIQRMCGHYQHLLTAMLMNPDDAVGRLALLTSDEQTRLVTSWNATHCVYPTTYSVPQLIAQQAQRRSTVLALEGPQPQRRVTYQQLNEQANQIARYLQRRGIGAESLVCACMERSSDLIIAELAILKAGAAYVPLDPAQPPSRLAHMLNDIQPAVLLTQQHWLDLVATISNACEALTVVCLDSPEAPCWQESTQDVDTHIELDQLAYVIYTSGSTGLPKGVQVTHRGLLNLVHWYQRAFQVTEHDRASHLASVGFDGTVWEIWPLLCAGATLLLPEEQMKFSAELLQQWYLTQHITLSFVPTPLAEQLLVLQWPAEMALRYMHTAGDQLHTFPGADLPFVLVNNYGPTENTVDATYEWVPTLAQRRNGEQPSIGRPLANVEAYVFDASLQPLPVGVPGELYLGGVALARGYLHQPALTAERFVPHPLSSEPGARLYKTGDVCAFLPDGRLNFIGRNDRQIKLRGFRIELGEVEAHIQQYPAVNQVALVAHVGKNGQKYLVAYMVQEQGHTLKIDELRSFLRTSMPEYMIPAYFLVLDALPLTSSGKLDRKALPAPELASQGEQRIHVAPQTQLELQLAEIWQDVLQCENVGIQDNFFDLGGHSLRMAQVHQRLQTLLQRKISLLDLFQHSTIQALAMYLQQGEIPSALQKREEQIQGGKQRLRHLRQRQQQMKGAV